MQDTWGGLGLTQRKCHSVSRRQQACCPGAGLCVVRFDAHVSSVMCLSGSRHFKQWELLSEEGCVESAALSSSKLCGAYRGGNQEEVGKSAQN